MNLSSVSIFVDFSGIFEFEDGEVYRIEKSFQKITVVEKETETLVHTELCSSKYREKMIKCIEFANFFIPSFSYLSIDTLAEERDLLVNSKLIETTLYDFQKKYFKLVVCKKEDHSSTHVEFLSVNSVSRLILNTNGKLVQFKYLSRCAKKNNGYKTTNEYQGKYFYTWQTKYFSIFNVPKDLEEAVSMLLEYFNHYKMQKLEEIEKSQKYGQKIIIKLPRILNINEINDSEEGNLEKRNDLLFLRYKDDKIFKFFGNTAELIINDSDVLLFEEETELITFFSTEKNKMLGFQPKIQENNIGTKHEYSLNIIEKIHKDLRVEIEELVHFFQSNKRILEKNIREETSKIEQVIEVQNEYGNFKRLKNGTIQIYFKDLNFIEYKYENIKILTKLGTQLQLNFENYLENEETKIFHFHIIQLKKFIQSLKGNEIK